MSIAHKDIPEAGLHEPKGVSTAAAKTAYIATGTGTGSWDTPQVTGQSSAVSGKVPVSDGSGGLTWVYKAQYGHTNAVNLSQAIALTAASLRSAASYTSITQYFVTSTQVLNGFTVDSTTKNLVIPEAGYYEINFWASIASSVASANIGLLRTLNGAAQTTVALAQYKAKSAGDIATISSSTIRVFAAGDIVGYAIASDTSTTVTLTDGSLSIKRL